jgi:glycosidase
MRFNSKQNLLIQELKKSFLSFYKPYGGSKKDFQFLESVLQKEFEARPKALLELDKRNKYWYLSKNMIGYMVYTDLFSQDLKKLVKKIPYLKELGITYVHLMPLLKSREGENDGGYAVEDYLDIEPNLGTSIDFENTLEAFREAKIDVCIDYVINHTADTHEWAQKALKGDKTYQDMYIMFDDRTIPDVYDQHVPEVLPDKCPGNFTYKEEIKKWVFTSFSDFQWDLNFKNPSVFIQMVDIMLQLANKGVTIMRLDAIPFMWKEEGTSCRNLPQIHDLLHMIHLIKDIVSPSLAILGEAIVQPDEIVKYFGSEEKQECGILYNANFMVNIWNAFATKDVRLLNIDNKRYNLPNTSCWMNYVRCHDDIGWGFNEEAIRDFNMDPFAHKQFLINFYSGNFYDSFSKGENYQYNAISKDARTNGTCASLLGLEKALEENYIYEQDVAIRRILLAHAMILSHRGIPLIYSGDEIATLNDQSYKSSPSKQNEGRWVHRPIFDWKRAKKRKIHNTFEQRVFDGLKQMIKIRKNNSLFNGDVTYNVIETSDISVYAFSKENKKEQMVFLFNFSEYQKKINIDSFQYHKVKGTMTDLLTSRVIDFNQGVIKLAPYEVLWLKQKI